MSLSIRDRQRPVGGDELADPLGQEHLVGRRQLKPLERRTSGRLPVAQRQIGPAGRAHEQIGAAVLVEEDHAGRVLLQLRQHEVENDGLAGARRAADERVAEVAEVEIEVERRAAGGLEQRDRRSPGVAVLAADRIAVERRQRREVARGDRARPGPQRKVAGQLRPPGRLQPQILARDDGAAVGQMRARLAHVVGELLDAVGIDGERQMMLAEQEAVGFEIVQRLGQFLDLRSRLVVGRDHLVLLAAHDLLAGGLGHEAERLRDDQLERQRQHAIEHARPRAGRVFLEAEQAGEPARALVALLDGLAADDDAVRIDRRGDRAVRQRHPFRPPADQAMQDLGQLGEDDAVGLIETEQARAIAGKPGNGVLGGVVQLLVCFGIEFDVITTGLAQPLDERTDLFRHVAGRRPDERQIEIVLEQLLAGHAGAVLGIEPGGEGVRELAVGILVRPAPDDMRPQRQALVADIAQQRIEIAMQRVDIADIGGLERDAVERDHGHDSARLEHDGVGVGMPDVGNVRLGRQLAGLEGDCVRQGRGPFHRSA